MDLSKEKLGKLSIAILEGFIGKNLGDGVVKELRSEYAQHANLVTALEETEKRFRAEPSHQNLAKALFEDMSTSDLPSVREAALTFYNHPTEVGFADKLTKILLAGLHLEPGKAERAINDYVHFLTKELTLVDKDFRKKVSALAILDAAEVLKGNTTSQDKQGWPILRIKEYGNEQKTLHRELWGRVFSEVYINFQEITGEYDTLFIEVFNKNNKEVAERVWSKIEWMNSREKVLVSHYGRWHIATETMRNEKIKENLQYAIFDSNQHSQKLYFAWAHKDGQDKPFYGLERDMDGNDSWNSEKYKLDAKQYIVRITLQGNNGVRQEFKYKVTNKKGKISISKALTDESKKDIPQSTKNALGC